MSVPAALCPVCETSLLERPKDQNIVCTRCGNFSITPSVTTTGWKPSDRAKLSGWIREQFALGENPELTTYNVTQIIERPEKSVAERIERLLDWAILEQRRPGKHVRLSNPSAIAWTYSVDGNDVIALAHYLVEEKMVHGTLPDNAQVTARGFIKHGGAAGGPSSKAFIAMWFDTNMSVARDQLEAAVRNAGYLPIVVNRVEHVNKIDDEIISQIRTSRFLVADFTGQRGGVYFEAGFAMGLGIPIFWTCKSDHIKDLHFDIRQYNSIDWIDETDLSVRLTRRIEAVIGRGPVSGIEDPRLKAKGK
jgi:hypothetical protein